MSVGKISNLLVRDGVLSRNWSDELDVLDEAKQSLFHDETTRDACARAFLADHAHKMKFHECETFLNLLVNGEDGKGKTFFTRRFTSPVINDWTEVLAMYKAKNLNIAETVRALRQAESELNALRRRIHELGLKLAEIDDKRKNLLVDIQLMGEKLEDMMTRFGIEAVSDIDQKLSEYFKTHAVALEGQTKLLAREIAFSDSWEAYASKHLPNESRNVPESVEDILSVAEELLAFFQVSSTSQIAIASTVRDLAQQTLAFDPEDELRKASAEIRRLVNACNHNKEVHRLDRLEIQIRDEISRSEVSINELQERMRGDLITTLNDGLAKLNRQPVLGLDI